MNGPFYDSAWMFPVLAALGLAAANLDVAPSAIEARLLERLRSFRGVMGIAATRLDTGERVRVNADLRFPTASTIKTAVMMEVFHQVAEGRLRKNEMLTLTEEGKVGGSGVLQGFHAGAQLSVADLMHLMITVSDNTATNLLVDRVGTANVDERLGSYGFKETKLFRATFRQGRPDVYPDLEKEFGLGMTTPAEMARLMELIATGRAVNPKASGEMLAILAAQKVRHMIPRALPATPGLVVANKTGEDDEKLPNAGGVLRGVRADAAIVQGAGVRYVIAVYARQVEDTRWSVDNDALVTGGELARMVHDHFMR
jgi:beta-lactamase class A